jgi:tRNA splicing ligase
MMQDSQKNEEKSKRSIMKFNLFRRILNELFASKIELIPNNPEDEEIAQQMSQMINYMQDIDIDGEVNNIADHLNEEERIKRNSPH